MPVSIFRKKVAVNEIELFVLDTQTQGPAILCLHGRWGRGETWADLMRRYGDRYRVIAPDQRGHGLSGKPLSRYTAEEMAADAIGLLDALGIESCVLVGHSMGAQNAAYAAALYPRRIRKVALLDKTPAGPAVRLDTPPEQIPDLDPLTGSWPLPFTDRAQARRFMREELGSGHGFDYFMNSLVETPEGYRMMFSGRAMAANIAYNVDWYGILPQIACPALLVRARTGESMPDDVWEKAQSLLGDCISREMPDSDHNVHLSDPEKFYGFVDELLELEE
ncbi:alpha/beta hydrolase [Saccharibacillus sp. CPCC 101409]|uniref:alpha/beta fold hydrolase n=1 Tax=Saccharibacillus sp. CPCC 101409 TaxID=3058041 RepID=UPI002671A385|nr:alpha/beta hydrolase [Saccharibacillus sp. CPCC 101409]MDO3410389.1 alpha/beta hydrolase [Saccharibacillus sp. CPCC 101409]